ncbi:MAG: TraB/GumN family protein [Methanosarcinaceae archaeon]|nr:TraB/GumN family protein [Methanosarcinaceae archaeon]
MDKSMDKSSINNSQPEIPNYSVKNTSNNSAYPVKGLATESVKKGSFILNSDSSEISSGFSPSVSTNSSSPELSGSRAASSSEQAGFSGKKTAKIVLVGTAHVSEKSVTEVRETIRRLKPDVVAIELCQGRYNGLRGNVQETQIPIKEILSEGKVSFYLVHWLLSYIQKKIGEEMGVRPGAEMLSAIEEAEASGAKIALIDRDIQVTLQRFWGKMKFTEKLKMLGSLLGGVLGIGKGVDIDIETVTEQDVVTGLVSELRDLAPTAAEVLIDERDAYLAGSLLRTAASFGSAPGSGFGKEGSENGLDRAQTIVAVIGAGHRAGVTKYLQNPKTIPPLNKLVEIPKKGIGITKIIGFGIVGLALATFLLLLLSGTSPELLFIAFCWWFLINGVLSAGGALLAGGHPYSILTAFLVAWLTSLNPMLAAGWFAGLMEAKQRNPTTDDVKALFGVETFREMLKNRFMRVLLVASFANIGSVIGTFLGVHIMLQVTGLDPIEIIKTGFSALGF